MRTVSLTKNLIAASVNCVSLAQTKAAAGNLVLNGGSVVAGVATLDTQRRVLITSDGNDSGVTATITGTNQAKQPISESLTMANAGAVASTLDFLSVGTVAVSGAIANHVTIGTNGTGSTPFLMPNFHLTPFDVDIDTQLTGSVTYSIETTQDDYFTAASPTVKPNVVAVLNAATAAAQIGLESAVRGYRYTITSGTGTLAAQSTQAGITNY